MIIWTNNIESVLSRIYIEGIARNGKAPQLYWDTIKAFENLDKSCLTVYSTTDSNCPIGWRRNKCPILTVGKKNKRLKFSYVKIQLDSGENLIVIEEVADTYGNILTESAQKHMASQLITDYTDDINESVENILSKYYRQLYNILYF